MASQAQIKKIEAERRSEVSTLADERDHADRRARKAEERVEIQDAQLIALRAKVRAAAIADARREAGKEKKFEAELDTFVNLSLKDKGRWSNPVRRAVRRLYNIGCSFHGISKALETVFDIVRVDLDSTPCVETAEYMVAEGGVIAWLHIIDELIHAKGEHFQYSARSVLTLFGKPTFLQGTERRTRKSITKHQALFC